MGSLPPLYFPVHFPAFTFSDEISVSLNVTRYSRLKIQRCISMVLSFLRASAFILFTDSSRMVTIGTVPSAIRPSRLASAIDGFALICLYIEHHHVGLVAGGRKAYPVEQYGLNEENGADQGRT